MQLKFLSFRSGDVFFNLISVASKLNFEKPTMLAILLLLAVIHVVHPGPTTAKDNFLSALDESSAIPITLGKYLNQGGQATILPILRPKQLESPPRYVVKLFRESKELPEQAAESERHKM